MGRGGGVTGLGSGLGGLQTDRQTCACACACCMCMCMCMCRLQTDKTVGWLGGWVDPERHGLLVRAAALPAPLPPPRFASLPPPRHPLLGLRRRGCPEAASRSAAAPRPLQPPRRCHRARPANHSPSSLPPPPLLPLAAHRPAAALRPSHLHLRLRLRLRHFRLCRCRRTSHSAPHAVLPRLVRAGARARAGGGCGRRPRWWWW